MSQVVTKNPSTNQVIVSGWVSPENAYTEDGVYTSSSIDGSEVKYGGWGFTENDIPPGSVITAVKVGVKHYEVNPSGYNHYTVLRYIDSGGAAHELQCPNRTSLTWDWYDITSYESSWDLNKLNNADCRIKMKESATGGCYSENTYFIRLTEDNQKEFVNVKEVKAGDLLHAYLAEEGIFGFARVKEVRCSEGEEWVTLHILPHYKRSKATNEMFAYQAHFTFTAEHPHRVWIEGLKESEYTQMTSKQIWEQLRNGNRVWLPCKLTRLSDKIVNVPIQRAELHIRKAKAYNVILERADALLSLEEFHPSDFVFLKKHGYSMAQFMDELPVPAVKSKETAYVDALALQVTFTPPTPPSAQQYNVGDSLAAANFQA
ncbi:MAG: hypothetical protein QXN95_00215 [Candidatus Bathyarchaeia archaeon]